MMNSSDPVNVPMVMKSYVISLERSPERRARAQAQQQRLGLPFELVNAVDGSIAEGDYTEAGYEPESGRILRNRYGKRGLSINEQACALSHMNVYARIIEDSVDVALVSEDDAVFGCSGKGLMQLIHDLPEGWDILYLYHRGDIRRIGPSLVSFKSVPGGAVSYLITRSAARSLLDLARPLRLASDALLGRSVSTGQLNGFGVFPLLARHGDYGESLLSNEGRKGAHKRVLRALKDYLLDHSMVARRVAFLRIKPDSYFSRLR